MALTQLPTRVDLDITDRRHSQTTKKRYAPVRGDSYEQEVAILDIDGNPFDLGPTIDPNWTFAAQLRDAVERDGGFIVASFSVVVIDGPTGRVKLKLNPEDTEDATTMEGVWDFQLVNVADTDFDPGFTATVVAGAWKMIDDVTVMA